MGAASATVKGGFFAQFSPTYTPIQNRSVLMRRVAQLMGSRSLMGVRRLAVVLDGAVAGSAASKTLGRVEANVELGGKRVIETNTIISRNTAAADITEINSHLLALSANTYNASPVANLDGNPLGTR